MTFAWSAFIGFFLGFVFGVGCALAVMYSIYAGGYRAAVKDFLMVDQPERLQRALRGKVLPASQTRTEDVLPPE